MIVFAPESPTRHALLERRAFLARARDTALGIGLCGALPVLSSCATVPFAEFRRSGGVLRVSRSVFASAPGVLLDFPDEGVPIYVHQHDAGRYSAVLTRCTHQGCQADPAGDRIRCPCHGSQYTLDGRVLEGPAERPLTRYPVSVEGDELLVEVGR